MNICPVFHDTIDPGFFISPVPRPLYLHDPPRPEYDGFNASKRAGYKPGYKWGDLSTGHKGVDLGVRGGDPVVASQSGAFYWVDKIDSGAGDAAGVHTAVVLRCPEGPHWFMFRDLHLEAGSIPTSVTRGTLVGQGEQIGFGGKTGNANWTHDHFEIRHSTDPNADRLTVYPSGWGVPYDPLAFGILEDAAVKPSDDLIDWFFAVGLSSGDPQYWKDMPATAAEWTYFVKDVQGGYIGWLFKTLRRGDDWRYWVNLAPGSPEWSSFWRTANGNVPPTEE